jgi:hypothetical protein
VAKGRRPKRPSYVVFRPGFGAQAQRLHTCLGVFSKNCYFQCAFARPRPVPPMGFSPGAAELLALLHQVFSQTTQALTLVIERAASSEAPDSPDTSPDSSAALREIEKKFLQAVADGRWWTVAELCRRCRYVNNSYARSAVSALLRAGLVERRGRKIRAVTVDHGRGVGR